MLKHDVIEPEFADAVNDADDSHVDCARVRVSARGSCVVLEIVAEPNSVRAPLLLSAAASRALAADLINAAESAEPSDAQD